MKKLKNPFKISVLFVLLIIIGTVTYFYNQKGKIQTPKTHLYFQQQCADASKTFFDQDKWGRASQDINSSNITYINHYNSKYNKCFILITENFFDGSGASKNLYDVLEHKEYATGSFGTNDYNFKKSYCSTLDGDCKSNDNFLQFVSKYMEN